MATSTKTTTEIKPLSWKQRFFTTHNDWTGTILRLTLGGILWPHGAQKLLGWFDGPGFSQEMQFFTEVMNMSWLVGLSVIIIEFFGALSLIIGLATRFWAVGVIGLMMGIIFTSHLEYGFFMNWFGNQAGEGFEYHLLFIGLALALLLQGSGKYAVDGKIQSS
jgi:putative oxidoreductase